jgi:hypothetical protein
MALGQRFAVLSEVTYYGALEASLGQAKTARAFVAALPEALSDGSAWQSMKQNRRLR